MRETGPKLICVIWMEPVEVSTSVFIEELEFQQSTTSNWALTKLNVGLRFYVYERKIDLQCLWRKKSFKYIFSGLEIYAVIVLFCPVWYPLLNKKLF